MITARAPQVVTCRNWMIPIRRREQDEQFVGGHRIVLLLVKIRSRKKYADDHRVDEVDKIIGAVGIIPPQTGASARPAETYSGSTGPKTSSRGHREVRIDS